MSLLFQRWLRRAAWTLFFFVYASAVSTMAVDVAYPGLPVWFVELWRWVVFR